MPSPWDSNCYKFPGLGPGELVNHREDMPDAKLCQYCFIINPAFKESKSAEEEATAVLFISSDDSSSETPGSAPPGRSKSLPSAKSAPPALLNPSKPEPMLRQERLPNRQVKRFGELDRKGVVKHLQRAMEKGQDKETILDQNDNILWVQLTIILKRKTPVEETGPEGQQYIYTSMPCRKIGKSFSYTTSK